MSKDLCKKEAELVSGFTDSGIPKTGFPLAIVFKKAKGIAGILERRADLVFNCSQILKRFRT